MLREEGLTGTIIRCFYRVYDEMGFGFLESVYRRALERELREAGLYFESEALIDVWYRGDKVGHFRADLVIDRKVIVEIKASAALGPADRKQLLNYLRASSVELGMLLHFGPKARFERLIFTNDQKRGRVHTVGVRP
ncbi:MAG TPA: GxxExxY protein [Gemmatimonadaceae bacterium]|jgi:GxxExxY protein